MQWSKPVSGTSLKHSPLLRGPGLRECEYQKEAELRNVIELPEHESQYWRRAGIGCCL